jgi:uncharacterized protein
VDLFEPRAEQERPLARTTWSKTIWMPPYRTPTSSSATTLPVSTFVRRDHVTFFTEPPDRETEDMGPLAAKRFVSSSTEDADIFRVVHFLRPRGSEVTFQETLDLHAPTAQEWLRASRQDEGVAFSFNI